MARTLQRARLPLALRKGAKAVKAMQDAIVAVDGHAEYVDIDKLTKIDVSSLGKRKDKEALKEKLLKAKYTGTDYKIYQWVNRELQSERQPKDTTKNSSSKKTLFNIASDSCIDAANAIVAAVTKGKKKMSVIVDDAYNTIPIDKHKKIHKDGTPDKVKNKIGKVWIC